MHAYQRSLNHEPIVVLCNKRGSRPERPKGCCYTHFQLEITGSY